MPYPPPVAYGQIVAWGQYVVGLGLWVLVLGWVFSQFPAMFAGILPVGFEGGHGTAAGMGPVFEKHNWPEGSEFALTSATFGILSAIIVGMVLINWAVRRGHVHADTDPAKIPDARKIANIGRKADTGPAGIVPIASRASTGTNILPTQRANYNPFLTVGALWGLAARIQNLSMEIVVDVEAIVL